LYYLNIKGNGEGKDGFICNIYKKNLGATRILKMMDGVSYEMVTRKAFSNKDSNDLKIKKGTTYRWKWFINKDSFEWNKPKTPQSGEFFITIDGEGNVVNKNGEIAPFTLGEIDMEKI